MAAITFYGNEEGAGASNLIDHGAGSGIGFYGGGFGISVAVDQHQDSTYVTNSAGTSSGIKLNNTKYTSASGVSHNSATVSIDNEAMPNYYAPLNVRFTHSEAVRVQNCKMRIFDRNDIGKQASGVSTYVYEVRHPDTIPTSGSALTERGEPDHAWKEYDPADSMVDTTFTSSPGVSGTNSKSTDSTLAGVLTAEGITHESLSHDWYVALSASPDSIGSKTDYGLYFTCEDL